MQAIGWMSYKATKPGLALSDVYLSMFLLYCCLLGPLLCIVSFRCYVFCLLVVLVELIVARGSSPESPGKRVSMIFLVYCIASLFYYVFMLSPAPM